MPATAPKSRSENPPRSLLLVEEYGALAVAIKSALRKFAPLHEVRVAAGVHVARELAGQIQPELVVLDVDPPPKGTVAFLTWLQAKHPQSRLLVLAAGLSAEFCAARGKTAAIQFVEKPFDLPEFGAAVQARIGPWNGPASGTYATASDLSLLDLAQVISACLSSTVLKLKTVDGLAGEVHFQRGQIIHAATGAKKGVPALDEIATWAEVRFSETGLAEHPHRTIDGAWVDLLLPIARRVAARKEKKSAHPPAPSPARQIPKTGRKILVVDDTELLLVFVADILSTFDPSLQIETAATGAEGLRLAKDLRPDLILLDYSLTDTTGDEICRQLLADETTARIPVLMMSGHFTELMRTAEDYRNVVDALPKPFLSGALISAVERALAKGPLPRVPNPPISTPPEQPPARPATPTVAATPPPKLAPPPVSPPPQPTPAPTPATSSVASPSRSAGSPPIATAPADPGSQSTPDPSAPPAETRRAPLPNGHEPHSEAPPTPPPPVPSSLGGTASSGTKPDNPVAVKAEPARPTTEKNPVIPQVGPARQTKPQPAAAPKMAAAVHPTPASHSRGLQSAPSGPSPGIAARFTKQTELSVTFSLEVAVVQLSPVLQVDAVRLRPVSRAVAVQMKGPNELRHLGFGVGFELGPFQLGANGQIETLRLIPTRESIELPANASSFQIGTITLQPANSHRNLELVAAQNFSMRVQLTASFELVRVELSPGFELQAIFVRTRGLEVTLRNSGESEGTRLELDEVEIDPTGELRTLMVRTIA